MTTPLSVPCLMLTLFSSFNVNYNNFVKELNVIIHEFKRSKIKHSFIDYCSYFPTAIVILNLCLISAALSLGDALHMS